MFIRKISIKGYRGVKEEEGIPLSNMSCIVGKNDSGKSIVLNAVASFLDTKKYPIVSSDFNNADVPIEIACSFSDPDLFRKIEAKVKTEIKKDDGLEEFVKDVLANDCLVIKSVFSKATNKSDENYILMMDYQDSSFASLYEKKDDELNTIITNNNIVIPISGSGRNSKLEKIKGIKGFCEESGHVKELKYIKDTYKITTLLPSVELFVSDYGLDADTGFKTGSVSEIKHIFEAEQSSEDGALRNAERKLETEMQKEAQSIKEFMLEYTGDLEDIRIVPSFDWPKAIPSVDVEFKFNGDSHPILMSHKGAGYRRLFMVARFRYLAEKNKGKDVVYLIEEPETFLHPSAQEDLLSALEDLSENNQIIISTHSPIFAGSVDYNSVILCAKTDQSHYEFAEGSTKESFMQKIIGELGIRPYYNLQDSHEKIVFVEGSYDIEFYNLVTEKLLEKSLKTEKILGLPFGGKESMEYFVNIEYFSKSGKKLFLILDKDSHLGQSDQDKQIDRRDWFLTKANSKAYVLSRACIDNYCHPRAFERVYSLQKDSIQEFDPNGNMQKKIIPGIRDANVGVSSIKCKNDLKVWEETTRDEWNEVIEDDLKTFLKSIIED